MKGAFHHKITAHFRKPKAWYLYALLFSALTAACSDDLDDLPLHEPLVAEQGELLWAKTFGGSGSESARAVSPTLDGGLAILGFSESTDGDLQGKTLAVNDYWLLKLDAEGALQWSRTIGGSKDDRGQSLIQTSDGGYVLTGYAMSDDGDGSSNQGFHDNWVVRLDAGGNILWERSFGFSGHDHSYDITQTEDGGFLFIGFMDLTAARADGFESKASSDGSSKGPSNLTRHGVGEFWCSKISSDGTLEWQYYFGGSNNDRAHAVVPSPDGGFVLAGFSESEDFDISQANGSYDFWVIKVDADGAMVWEKNLGGSGIEIASDLAISEDRGYLIAGHSFSTDGDRTTALGEADIWVVKLSENGDMLWERSYGGPAFDAAESISALSDGNFLISGTSRSQSSGLPNAGENDLMILKIDADGNLLWERTFGGAGIDLGFDATEGPDGAVYVVGEWAEPGNQELPSLGGSDLILLKFR